MACLWLAAACSWPATANPSRPWPTLASHGFPHSSSSRPQQPASQPARQASQSAACSSQHNSSPATLAHAAATATSPHRAHARTVAAACPWPAIANPSRPWPTLAGHSFPCSSSSRPQQPASQSAACSSQHSSGPAVLAHAAAAATSPCRTDARTVDADQRVPPPVGPSYRVIPDPEPNPGSSWKRRRTPLLRFPCRTRTEVHRPIKGMHQPPRRLSPILAASPLALSSPRSRVSPPRRGAPAAAVDLRGRHVPVGELHRTSSAPSRGSHRYSPHPRSPFLSRERGRRSRSTTLAPRRRVAHRLRPLFAAAKARIALTFAHVCSPHLIVPCSAAAPSLLASAMVRHRVYVVARCSIHRGLMDLVHRAGS
jgi:hypothetical protein